MPGRSRQGGEDRRDRRYTRPARSGFRTGPGAPPPAGFKSSTSLWITISGGVSAQQATGSADNPREMNTHHQPTRRLRITTGPGALRRLARGLRRFLVVEVRGPEARALTLLAVEEIAANILEHGYRGQAGQPIEVLLAPTGPRTFRVTLKDRATFLDRIVPGDLKDLARKRTLRGRGMALVTVLTLALSHGPRKGGGNVWTLEFDAEHLTRLAEEHSRGAA